MSSLILEWFQPTPVLSLEWIGPTGTLFPSMSSIPTPVLAAIIGPPGPSGTAGGRYIHTQSSPLAIWTVPHNLGFRPDVTITTIGGQEVWGGEVLHLSFNTLTLTFDVPFVGYADCA